MRLITVDPNEAPVLCYLEVGVRYIWCPYV